MALKDVSLDDKYTLEEGLIWTGSQLLLPRLIPEPTARPKCCGAGPKSVTR